MVSSGGSGLKSSRRCSAQPIWRPSWLRANVWCCELHLWPFLRAFWGPFGPFGGLSLGLSELLEGLLGLWYFFQAGCGKSKPRHQKFQVIEPHRPQKQTDKTAAHLGGLSLPEKPSRESTQVWEVWKGATCNGSGISWSSLPGDFLENFWLYSSSDLV